MMTLPRFAFSICILFLFLGCVQKNTSSKEESISSEAAFPKINGLSFVASRDTLRQANIKPILDVHTNYVSVMPFGFIKSPDHPKIIYNQERQWYGETKHGVKQYVEMFHKNKIHVMLKPQIWVGHGQFTGLLEMNSEENWKALETSYSSFILEFAQVAEENQIELFCIGTELEKFIENRPGYWHKLIAEIKSVYKGKLTYAANWDEYKRVPFWDALDYIGVDAYFPVATNKTPTVDEAKAGWQQWKDELKSVSEKENKKIIFTEYGYRNIDFAGKEPWVSDRELNSLNHEAQTNTLQALYEEVWKEDWFSGGFLWKWFMEHDRVGGNANNQFTPQNKPAENIVKKYYKEIK
ncbi:glycoside hydrolase [Galbibacter sp. EGI 63066]|uniref:glycoside hydrolase family 113 n=1 Tax=Galbibacter sp. EGI 63066 TaxID=2993559 RepID=UPI002248A202|nr:glycoside hydrolase [Galbibacter sp. EGI 63066]MCX2682046.1 glycoside hydrolase [Galbibacter sp. EGI 63066]